VVYFKRPPGKRSSPHAPQHLDLDRHVAFEVLETVVSVQYFDVVS